MSSPLKVKSFNVPLLTFGSRWSPLSTQFLMMVSNWWRKRRSGAAHGSVSIEVHKMRDWEEQPKFSSDIKDEGKPQGSKATIVDCSTCLRYIFVGIQLTIVLEIYAKNPCSLIDPITMICYIMMVTLFLVSGTSMDNCYFQLAGWQLVIREAVS